MLSTRNSNLIVNICEVQLKSAHGAAFPTLAGIYTSLSKINWSSSTKTTDDGTLYSNKLTLNYPGLDQDQFSELDKFIRGLYQVRVITDTGARYQLAGDENPMEVEINFNGGATEINFSHAAIEPIQYLGNSAEEAAAEIGFPYYLTFNLA